MAEAVLTISSKNYSSWSLRGWLLCKMAGLDFEEEILSSDDPSTKAELLLMSPSFLVPCLTHENVKVWDTLAIGEYLAERFPGTGLLPEDIAARAHCRAISGEMHSGFQNLRSALPMNLKAKLNAFSTWSGVKDDVERVLAIWRDCLQTHGGPYLFGAKPVLADAMYAPVCTRFRTYGVSIDEASDSFCETIMSWPLMLEWIEAAKAEPEELEELDVEF